MLKRILIGVFALAICVVAQSASAALTITNGNFEAAPVGANLPDVNLWNDSTTGQFFQQTWQSNAAFQIPSGSSAVIFSSFESGAAGSPSPDANDGGWLYESIGTADGAGSVDIRFDWGTPADDGGGGRNLGLTVGIYAYDGVGAFTPADGTDVRGAAGATLLNSVPLTFGPTPGGFAGQTELVTLSLAGAGTQELFLRFNNYRPGTTESWPWLDNISIVPEPASIVLIGLSVVAILGRRRL